MINTWFNQLEQRDRKILLLGAIAAGFFILLSIYLNVHDAKIRHERQLSNAMENMTWVDQAVQKIKGHSGSSVNTQMRNKSLIQISEMAAGRTNIRSTRFQPNGVNDAQIWFEAVPFSALMQYISRMEQDFGVTIESVSINSAKTTGLINARIKFSKSL